MSALYDLRSLTLSYCVNYSNAMLYAHQHCADCMSYFCRYGGHTEAVKRILAQLPISAQSYSCSPYLDLNLFSYDDKWVSVMERPKTCGDYPIRY